MKRLQRDDILYVTEKTRPHPIAGYSKAHKEYGIMDIRGYKRGAESLYDIKGVYTPNSKDTFRLHDGHLPPYQPTTTGDKLLVEMRRLNIHSASRIAPVYQAETEFEPSADELKYAEALWQTTKEDAEHRDIGATYLWSLIEHYYPDKREKQIHLIGFMNEVNQKYGRAIPKEKAFELARKWGVESMFAKEFMEFLPYLEPTNIDLLAKTEGDPLRKFCCRQCGECAPEELLEEGKFLERISWLRHHYKEKHPGMWGKQSYQPQTKDNVYTVPEWPEVKGIFVGGCVERGPGSSFRAKAHAHCRRSDPYFGWICVRSIKRLGEVEGNVVSKPSRLLWHEYAHILTPDHYHDDVWRRKMQELGQPIPEQYRKKPRGVTYERV